MQSYFWADFKEKTGWGQTKLGFFENDRLVGGAVVLKYFSPKGKNFFYIPEGPILPFDRPASKIYFQELMKMIQDMVSLEKQKPSYLRIEPRLQNVPDFFHGFHKASYNFQPPSTLIIDLHKNEEEILRQMLPKGRYNIKVAERSGVEIIMDDTGEGLKYFLPLYRETIARNKFRGKDDFYLQSLITTGKEHIKFFFAIYQGIILAAALVIFYGSRATYFFGASSNRHRKVMAPYKLHFEIIRFSKNHGYRWYDFWGISSKIDSAHHWHGLSQFKRKFGGKQFDFIGAYDLDFT